MKKRIILVLLMMFMFFMTGCVQQSAPKRKTVIDLTEVKKTDLKSFLANSVEKVLNAEDENPIYSPLGLYLVLSMMAETLSDEVRIQVLNFFGVESD